MPIGTGTKIGAIFFISGATLVPHVHSGSAEAQSSSAISLHSSSSSGLRSHGKTKPPPKPKRPRPIALRPLGSGDAIPMASIGPTGKMNAASGRLVAVPQSLETAKVGTAVPGLPGAVWTDIRGDGRVHGYTLDGHYYEGTAFGLGRNVATSFHRTSPHVGTPVAGVPGAIWQDCNGDGKVDGFVFKRHFYPLDGQKTCSVKRDAH
jgi:hypothetical protein